MSKWGENHQKLEGFIEHILEKKGMKRDRKVRECDKSGKKGCVTP